MSERSNTCSVFHFLYITHGTRKGISRDQTSATVQTVSVWTGVLVSCAQSNRRHLILGLSRRASPGVFLRTQFLRSDTPHMSHWSIALGEIVFV